ncbi:DUF3302 domain-containing protein [Roseibium sp.]|uniref:DUF3302 domain-containing protein n=1 Tax=Roseibium sp. TaxID=1936156 RepID=UPI003B50046C
MIFALLVLLVLVAAMVGIWVFLAIWPGKIARRRGHPKADAVAVCGYWGALSLGILMPLAFIWAFSAGQEPATETQIEDAA